MIDKKDYETRFNSYLKHISGDGQTIKNLMDVFNDMLDEIASLNNVYEMRVKEIEQRHDNDIKKLEDEKQREIDKRFKLKAGDIKTATYRALKRYLDEEFKEVLDA